MWELAQLCRRFGALPLEGGVAEQPFGALVEIRTLLSYAEDYQAFEQLGTKAPATVQARVFKVMALSVRPN